MLISKLKNKYYGLIYHCVTGLWTVRVNGELVENADLIRLFEIGEQL